MIDSRLLRHVVALADAGSFSRAADMLGISQPALSRSIAGLEQDFDVRLFDRGPRSVLPTAAGRAFIQEARSILAQSRALEQQLLQSRTTELGDVAFGCGPGIATAVLPALLRQVARERPRLNVKAFIHSADSLLQALHDEQIDFFAAVAAVTPPDERRETEIVGILTTGLFVRLGHPLADRRHVAQHDILAYPILSGMASNRVDRRMANAGLQPTIACDSYHTLVETVLHTDAILSGAVLIAQRLAPDLLVQLDVAGASECETYPIALVQLKGRTLSPASQLLKTWFVNCLPPSGLCGPPES